MGENFPVEKTTATAGASTQARPGHLDEQEFAISPGDAIPGHQDAPSRRSLQTAIKAVYRVSLVRTAYLSARFSSRIIVLRGTRFRLDQGAAISVARGSRLILGISTRHAGTPCTLRMRSNARLTVRGNAEIFRGTTVLIGDNAHLEIGDNSYINFSSTVTCFEHISIGSGCAISWNTNMLDGNAHELVVDGAARPRTQPVVIGDEVWIGAGATILSGVTISDGSVVAAGSVVTADVPGRTVAAGNPARVVSENVTWRM
jgi:acetyltransferase-like isoleucine patch superfamily enzyme